MGSKGGYQSSPAVVQEMPAEMKQNVALQNKYLEQISPVLSDLVNKGSTALNQYQAPDYSQYYQSGLNTTLDASNMAKSLAQGNLPSAYKANMDASIQEALSPYQQQFAGLAGRGVINSSLGKDWASSASKAAQTAANLAYNQNMSAASQLTNQYGQTATAPLAYQNTYYQTQTQPAKDFLQLGTATYQPVGQAANQAYQWQAAMSAPAQNNYVQQPGFGSVLGSIAGGLAGNAGLFGRR